MHYKNGREAKIGDAVIGKTYNRKGIQCGVLVGITPGQDTCNCRVAIADALPLLGHYHARAGVVHTETTSGEPVSVLVSPAFDFSACGDLYHAEDAFARIEDVAKTPAPAMTEARATEFGEGVSKVFDAMDK